MLHEINIVDLALISRAQLSFGPGFNVLTGETGAGKSILIDAISLALGGRASTDSVRAGAERSAVDLVVDLSRSPVVRDELIKIGLAEEGDDIAVFSREVWASGRSLCRVNGRPATASTVRGLASRLVEIQGQHEFQRLFRPEEHVLLLDAFGGPALGQARAEAEHLARSLAESRRRLRQLEEDEKERLRRQDLLRFQVDEIDAAGLRPGEERDLAERRSVMANAVRLLEGVAQAYSLLAEGGDGRPALVGDLGRAEADLARLSEVDARLATPAAALREAACQVEEAVRQLRFYRDSLVIEPGEQSAVEERLDLVRRLQKKYGATVEEVTAYRQQAAADLERLAGAEEEAGGLVHRIDALREEMVAVSARLADLRRQAAARLEQAVAGELEALGMGVARFSVSCGPAGEPGGDGDGAAPNGEPAGRVEFLFSANAGEPLLPLARVASGGEAARLMLAVKAALAAVDPVPTLIFDEVDAGLGGRAAQAVGEKLAAQAASHQVLCVTHLAPVAALADAHILVTKVEEGGRTLAVPRALSADERPAEISRMLAGDGDGPTSLAHARELLAAARQRHDRSAIS